MNYYSNTRNYVVKANSRRHAASIMEEAGYVHIDIADVKEATIKEYVAFLEDQIDTYKQIITKSQPTVDNNSEHDKLMEEYYNRKHNLGYPEDNEQVLSDEQHAELCDKEYLAWKARCDDAKIPAYMTQEEYNMCIKEIKSLDINGLRKGIIICEEAIPRLSDETSRNKNKWFLNQLHRQHTKLVNADDKKHSVLSISVSKEDYDKVDKPTVLYKLDSEFFDSMPMTKNRIEPIKEPKEDDFPEPYTTYKCSTCFWEGSEDQLGNIFKMTCPRCLNDNSLSPVIHTFP